MRSFLIWLFRDIFWENILWIGLGAAVLIGIFMAIGFFVSDETLDRWEKEDRDAGSAGQAGGEEGSWVEDAAGLAPSLRSLAVDDTGGDDPGLVEWLTED